MHQVVTSYLTRGRSGSKAQKTRAEVRGGGAKPWRQKGTGRARAGTKNSPIWSGGGVTFAAKPRKFAPKVNRKMYRSALQVILSELVRSERLLVLDEFTLEAPKTKLLSAKLKELDAPHALIVLDQLDDTVRLAARNLPNVACVDVSAVNPVLLVHFEKIIMTTEAVKRLEERLQ